MTDQELRNRLIARAADLIVLGFYILSIAVPFLLVSRDVIDVHHRLAKLEQKAAECSNPLLHKLPDVQGKGVVFRNNWMSFCDKPEGCSSMVAPKGSR